MVQGAVEKLRDVYPCLLLDYKAYYTGDLCAEFKRVLNELEIPFKESVNYLT